MNIIEKYINKCERMQEIAVLNENWDKVRSLQFKIDNALQESNRGSIKHLLPKPKPNRKTRRSSLKQKIEEIVE